MKAALFALASLLLGCSAQQAAPGLLQLTELSAREVGSGDKLELTGAGFPEGRIAQVTFRGDVFRPGRPAEKDVEVSIPARTATPHVLEATITQELVTAFCGRDGAAHATFRGDVVAAFAPRKSGAPPVSGALEGIVLDVEPSHESDSDRALASQEGQRFAAFLGITIGAEGRGPLRVQKVEASGRGAEVGLLAGDVLQELSGVRIGELADFVPAPRARVARIGLHRGGLAHEAVIAVDVAEFKPGTLSDLIPALALVGSAILALLIALSPLGRFTTWLELSLLSRSRGAQARELGSEKPRPWQALGRGISSTLPATPAAYLGVALGSALLALEAFGVPIVARELDLPTLLLAAGAALSTSGFLAEASARRKLSLLAGLRRALWIALGQLPLSAALLVAVIDTGSLRADDFAAAQAGGPWHFLAFSSPVHFTALLLGVFALVPEATISTLSSLEGGRASRLPALAAVEWTHLVIAAGLLCVVLLGGFGVPWLSELDRVGTGPRMALGATILVLKTFGLVLVVATLRWALGRVSMDQCHAALLRVGLPLALVLPVASKLWSIGAQGLVLSTYRGAVALSLFVATAASCLVLARRFAQNLRAARSEPSINPWL